MGSVSSTNAGLSDLLQTLSNENSPLLGTLSSPAIETALENAPPGDIAQISDEAMQLQFADAIFGDPNSSSTSSNSLFSELESITSAGATSPTATTSPSSLADQLAAYQGSSQLEQTQALLGITQPTNPQSSLFDVFA
jgi:hypothetical protein